MLQKYLSHNRFKESVKAFISSDPHLLVLSQMRYQHSSDWWQQLNPKQPGIYILTGGRQVGKSTSCKLFIKFCLQQKLFTDQNILYLPCDEIFDAKELSFILRYFLQEVDNAPFLLIIDEITFVKDWDRVIKALADEGCFRNGICLLTGSDTLILKDAAMRFPGRRGRASKTDFHLFPLTFAEYVNLIVPQQKHSRKDLYDYFQTYLQCGGYLRAINDVAENNEISQATYLTYEQWIRGDFLKHGKNEDSLMAILRGLLVVGVGQISYSALTQKIGLISKETVLDYCRLLERMDILINLQAFDQNKKQGFPRKDRKFHFTDPFIYRTILHWLQREGYLNSKQIENTIIEATVASHCKRIAKAYYFKGQGEIDVIWLRENLIHAIEVKWAEQIRPNDLKMLKHFKNSIILTKNTQVGSIENIESMPVYQFLYDLGSQAR